MEYEVSLLFARDEVDGCVAGRGKRDGLFRKGLGLELSLDGGRYSSRVGAVASGKVGRGDQRGGWVGGEDLGRSV